LCRWSGAPTSGKAAVTTYVREAGISSWYEVRQLALQNVAHRQICELLADNATRHWHEEQQVPYLVHGDQWWGYDDVESIRNKMRWLRFEGYGRRRVTVSTALPGGAFVWTLDFDDFNGKCPGGEGVRYPLTRILAEELAGITDLEAAAGMTTTTTTTTATKATPRLTTRSTAVTRTTEPPSTTARPFVDRECVRRWC